MAEATDPFTSKTEIERKETFPDHTSFGFLAEILFNPKNDLEQYPELDPVRSRTEPPQSLALQEHII